MMRTSYELRGTIRHPAMGAWLNVMQGGGNKSLPNFVFVGDDSRHPGAGFLPSHFSPLFVNNPENGLKNVKLQPGLTEDRFQKRMKLATDLDREFRSTFPQHEVKAYAEMYDDALTMMKSEDLRAFDLTEEKPAVRDRYGRAAFGQGCLLARRLVERAVRFVEVSLKQWDTHVSNFVRVPEQCDILDRALAALLEDLAASGLLKHTLVVLTTEFGRTPDINQNVGRDHYPKAFSSVLAGGGIAGGCIHGRTDAEGRKVVEKKMTIQDLNATIAYALGLPLDQVAMSPSNRPFTIADEGQPVTEIFG
jgi:hypothetical protein